MAVSVGEIVEGKVTGVTKFGAFIELPEKQVGMVHISEVSTSFVKEIGDYLEKGQVVKVKVLNVDPSGKISLSIKRVGDGNELKPQPRSASSHGGNGNYRDGNRPERKTFSRSAPNVWQGSRNNSSSEEDMSFEEKMAKFKKESDDKLTDLKHATESKHGGFSRRGGNKVH